MLLICCCAPSMLSLLTLIPQKCIAGSCRIIHRPFASGTAESEVPVVSVYIDIKSPHSYLALQVCSRAQTFLHQNLTFAHNHFFAAYPAVASRLQVFRASFMFSQHRRPLRIRCLVRWLPYCLSYKDLGVTQSDSGDLWFMFVIYFSV
jgi:hypothetical protein